MSQDLREASLIGRLTDIVKAKYRQKDFYGPDVSALDVPMLHEHAHAVIKPSRNPNVFLLMRNKFQAAGCATMLANFGCKVTVCFNGRDAYNKHLRRNADRFDLAIVEWEQPDINGRDLVHYCRGEGFSLCFLALVGSQVLPGMAIRGGANLFLRSPLSIHMHVIRRLLLPSEITATGFPTHVLVSRSHFSEMAHVLGSIRSKSDEDVQMIITEAINQIREDGDGDDHDVIDTIVDNLKRVLAKATQGVALSATDKQIMRLQGVVRNVLLVSKDCKIAVGKSLSEVRDLRTQLKECMMLHRYVPLNDHAKMDELESFSKTELKQRVAILQRQQVGHLEKIDQLKNDCEVLMKTNAALQKALSQLEDGDLVSPVQPKRLQSASQVTKPPSAGAPLPTPPHDAGSPRAAAMVLVPNSSFGNPMSPKPARTRFMSMADLRNSINKRPKAQTKPAAPSEVCERLECSLMAREDNFSAARPQPDAVPINISWSTARSVPLSDVYAPVAKVMEQVNGLLNGLSSRLLATYPKVRPRLLDFARELHAVFNAAPPATVFVLKPQPTNAMSPGPSSSPTVHDGADRRNGPVMTVKQRILVAKSKAVDAMQRVIHTSISARFMLKWKLYRIMRRGFVSSAEEERLLRRTRGNRDLTEAKMRADKAEQQVAHAQSVIKELKAQIDAAWQPPAAPLIPVPPLVQIETMHRAMQTDPEPVVTLPAPVAVPVPSAPVAPPSPMEKRRSTLTRKKSTAAQEDVVVAQRHTSFAPVSVNMEAPAGVTLRTAVPDPGNDSRHLPSNANAARSAQPGLSSETVSKVSAANGGGGQVKKQRASSQARGGSRNSKNSAAIDAVPQGVGAAPTGGDPTASPKGQSASIQVERMSVIIAEKDREIACLEERVTVLERALAERRHSVATREGDGGSRPATSTSAVDLSWHHGGELETGDPKPPQEACEATVSNNFSMADVPAREVDAAIISFDLVPTADPKENDDDGYGAAPPNNSLAVRGASSVSGSVVGAADCVLERRDPPASAVNPFLVRPPTVGSDGDGDETLGIELAIPAYTARDEVPSRQGQTPPMAALIPRSPQAVDLPESRSARATSLMPAVKPRTPSSSAQGSSEVKTGASAAPPPAKAQALLSFLSESNGAGSLSFAAASGTSVLPMLASKSLSMVKGSSVKDSGVHSAPGAGGSHTTAPLPPLQSRAGPQSPRAAAIMGGGDPRDALKSLLMAQSARSAGPPADAVPVATPRSRSQADDRSSPKPADTKKLFAKLGIGKMPKVNPKPAQMAADFALTARK